MDVGTDVVGLADARGGKAGGLARLVRAGLPVPAGFVVAWTPPELAALGTPAGVPDDDACARLAATALRLRACALPDALADAVRDAAARLGGPVAVRSSSSIEDRPAGAAPGLLHTELDVDPARVVDGLRAVWASAATPAVWAYLARAGASFASLAVHAIVQRQIAPVRARGTAYTRPELIVEPPGAPPAIAALARRAEAAIDAADPGADVEWVIDDAGAPWVVQVRPIAAPLSRGRAPDPALWADTAGDDTIWRWDVAHNPDPLSPAQAGLVARVGGDAMRVIGDYLYTADRGPGPAVDARDVVERFRDELAPAMDRALAGAGDDASLAAALAAYDRVYDLYAHRLGPALAAARRELPRAIAAHDPRLDAELCAAEWIGTGSGARRDAMRDRGRSPVWDVAVPAWSELRVDEPGGLATPIAAPAAVPPALRAHVARARELAELAELDDGYFARAQAAVRGALLRTARAWRLAEPDDVFYLPLSEVADRAARGEPPDPADAHRRARAAHDRLDAARAVAMPLAIADGRAVADRQARATAGMWRGRGCGGRAVGRALVLDALADVTRHRPAAGEVLVCRAFTPAMGLALHGAVALVIEHGALLDHGPAMARELGLPCVVGCAGVTRGVRTGDELWVDGPGGAVVRMAAE